MSNQTKFIRWGVVGCGQIAVDKSIPGLLAAKGARLTAIADPLAARRELALGLAGKAGLSQVTAYRDAAELFADPEVDAVYIALPTGDHADAVVAAAGAGKAILCEKPLGRSAEEVARMVQAADDAGVPLMTAYMSRFSDVFQKAAALIREGAIGKVTFVTSHFSYSCYKYYPPGAPGGWRYTDATGGGALLDVGVYLAFGVREMLGERIARVSPLNCDTFKPAAAVVPDTTAAWFLTEGGIPGTLVTTFSHDAQYIHFYGTKGNLTVTDCFYQTPGARLEIKGENPFVLDTKSDAGLAHFDNYRREFEHFSHALLTGTAHSPSADDVLADAILLDALKQNTAPAVLPSTHAYLESLSCNSR
jgi:D-xylose 1-dehydrogenase (NADP+, D-xylono-1,5-lactone-forming)